MKQSTTNKTMLAIREFLFAQGVFGWRQNSTGLYDQAKRTFRGSAKVGVSDNISVLPLIPVDNSDKANPFQRKFKKPLGFFLGVEIKTGKDILSPEQEGFILNIRKMGGEVLVVESKADFVSQYADLLNKLETNYGLTIAHK